VQPAEAIEPKQQAAKFIFPAKYSLDGIEPLFKNGRVEEWFAATFGASSTAEVRVDIGYHPAIENGFPVRPARLNSLGQQLLTYIRSNRTALVDYGARYRAGRRVSTSLAESAVNSLVAKRMVKNQQMRWSPSGAHLMLQVRAAMVNGNLRQRLREKPDQPVPPLHPIFQPTSPLLRAA
jgi:hypothetical protein